MLSEQRCRGLRIEDFIVATRDGKIIGCLALWDQSLYKQVVVRDYHNSIAPFRGFVNTLSTMLGFPQLPKRGQAVSQVYISHIGIDDDVSEILKSMLQFAGHLAAKRGHELILVGLAEKNTMLKTLRKSFRHICYTSNIYLVYWDDQQPNIEQLTRNPIHLDIAVL